jgi:hypothetical protein
MMAITSPPPVADREPIDDYHVQSDPGQLTRPSTHHVLSTMNGLMLIIISVLSFALFWVVATLFRIM